MYWGAQRELRRGARRRSLNSIQIMSFCSYGGLATASMCYMSLLETIGTGSRDESALEMSSSAPGSFALSLSLLCHLDASCAWLCSCLNQCTTAGILRLAAGAGGLVERGSSFDASRQPNHSLYSSSCC